MYKKYSESDRQKLYDETGNPLYAWHEIHYCILNEKLLPDWVLKYLEEVAFKFRWIRNPTADKKGNRVITDALGITNTSIFNNQDDEKFEIKYDVYKRSIWMRLNKNRLRGHEPEDEIAEITGKSTETIKIWCKEIRDWIDAQDFPLLPGMKEKIACDMKVMRSEGMKKREIILRCHFRSLNYETDDNYQAPYPKRVFEGIFNKTFPPQE